MSLTAIYMNRRGAGVSRPVTPQEAVDILARGRFGARTARIEDSEGRTLGERFQNQGHFPELRQNLWICFYDGEALRNAE